MLISKIIRVVVLYVSALYLKYKLRDVNSASKDVNIYFSRGTFKHDIDRFISEGNGTCNIVLDALLLRRLLRYAVPDLCLEQIICLNYKMYLENELSIVFRTFKKSMAYADNKVNLIFGGVDYFEVAIFCNREQFKPNVKFISYFHENYTIGYVESVSHKIYDSILDPFQFDELYVYGQSAYNILGKFTLNDAGPMHYTMPRLTLLKEQFSNVINIHSKNNKVKVLYLAFPGYDYLAPLCFSSILLELASISSDFDVCVKFKNNVVANKYSRRLSFLKSSLELTGEGSVGEHLKVADVVVVFNSLSFYESLLSDAFIIIPCFSDTDHDVNLLQESNDTLSEIYDFKTIQFAKSEKEISRLIKDYRFDAYNPKLDEEKSMRLALLNRKFY